MTTRGPIRIAPSGRFLEGENVGDVPVWDGSQWQAGAGGSALFGSDYQTTQDPGAVTTSSEVFITVSSLVTPVLDGLYRVRWHGVFNTSGSTSPIEIRLFDLGVGQVGSEIIAATGTTAARRLAGGLAALNFSNEAKTFLLQIRRTTMVGSVTLEDRVIEFWKVAA